MVNSSKRFAHTIAYKLEVVRYTKEHANRATERHFIPLPSEKMIWQWRTQEKEINSLPGTHRNSGGIKKPL